MLAFNNHASDEGDFAAGGHHFDGGTSAGGVRGAGLGYGGGEEVGGGGVEGGVADRERYTGVEMSGNAEDILCGKGLGEEGGNVLF